MGDRWSIATLIITSISFAAIGLLSLFYFLINDVTFIKLALYLSAIIVIILIVYIFLVSVCAIPYKQQEIDKIIEYATIRQNNKKKINKTKTKNKSKNE